MQEDIKILASRIRFLSKNYDTDKVYVLGSELENEEMKNLISKLQDSLIEQKLVLVQNVLYKPEELDKLSEAKVAVMLERENSALLREIAKEKELLEKQNTALIGAAMLCKVPC